MYFPIYTIPNFYDNPDEIIKKANTFDYTQEATDGIGVRTKSLHNFDYPLFHLSNDKILRTIFGAVHKCTYVAENVFCRMKNVKEKNGNIHCDEDTLLTIIIYLSKNLKNSGTNVYDNNLNQSLLATSNGAFNTAFCFDGCFPHQALHNLKENQERLTQAIFFTKLDAPFFPMAELKRGNK